MTKIAVVVAVTALVSGCATSPKNIAPNYVSPVLYQNLSCAQLTQEAQRVSNAAAAATGQQQRAATGDAVATGVSLILFWPAVFFIGGDRTSAGQVAQLKGEMQTIQQVSDARKCGIQFQQG